VRVLLQGRSARSIATSPGGDQVLLEATAHALRTYHGVDAVPSSALEPDLGGFDAVHLFGIVRPQEVWVQARNARRQGKPVLLSTVYCDVTEFEATERAGPVGWLARHTSVDAFEALKAAGRAAHNREWGKGATALVTRGFTRLEREIVDMTALFLPNSWSEWRRLSHSLDLRIGDDRVVIVPNGVDLAESDVGSADPDELRRLEHLRDSVLCVARIEGRKNQLRLIEALQGTDLTLVLAGRATPNQTRYVAKVRTAADSSARVHYLGGVSSDTKLALYSLARVHALPSWMETTGLSSIEAAVGGCSLVISPNGDTEEYFGDLAEYCDPGDVDSIREAVLRAYAMPPSMELARKIQAEYTWERAAAKTYAAYQRVIAERA
jgi:glycosyltransferase involved in cell wall biosynthesis